MALVSKPRNTSPEWTLASSFLLAGAKKEAKPRLIVSEHLSLIEIERMYSLVDAIDLKEETGCQTAELWILDLSSFDSVKAFADKFNDEGGRLDILVENAAVTPSEPVRTTSDGWEETSVSHYKFMCCSVPLH